MKHVKTISLLVMPLVIAIVYWTFKIQYYSSISSMIFGLYLLILAILGFNKSSIKEMFIVGFFILTVSVQWYGIDLTLKSIQEMNENPGYFEYSSDFVVILSWILLFISVIWFNSRVHNKT